MSQEVEILRRLETGVTLTPIEALAGPEQLPSGIEESRLYCKCGCGGKSKISKANVTGLPNNYIHGHNRNKPIEAYVIPEPNSGCHLWIGGLDRDGYGKKSNLGKMQLAHRLVYEMEHGEIPKGFTLDHLCRIRSCVNPRHMEVVTSRENILRGYGPPACNFRKKFCPKCSGPYKKDNRGRRVCVNCKNTYQRNRRTISLITI